MGDKSRGIYGKFNVSRVDGSDNQGGKHDGCEYFVLDATHDPYATPALRAYADACAAEYPLLAADICKMMAANTPATVIRCPEKLKPGGCQLHNLHCGWPDCNKPKASTGEAGA